jgi:uncharacterized protein
MSSYDRFVATEWKALFAKPFVHLVFGARQTGKSTLIRSLLPDDALIIDLADPGYRSALSLDPSYLMKRCRALPPRNEPYYVFIDEAQNIPAVFDAVQSLYDGDSERYRFILCGSSARKLRDRGTNRLPGRSMLHNLFPLLTDEYQGGASRQPDAIADFLSLARNLPARPFPARSLEDRLVFGDLPGVARIEEMGDRERLLFAYANAHLEEEIRREAIIKDWSLFLRFLRFSSREAGGIVNFQGIARESGVSSPTIKAYYRLLEDMYQGFFVDAWSGSARKSALSSPRFFWFDNGVRNAAAGYPLRLDLVNVHAGQLFEHFVGAELYRLTRYAGRSRLLYWRTSDGAEVDFILERDERLLPIEVKWTESPSIMDARHLATFVKENPDVCDKGLVICRCREPLALSDAITALPWQAI